MPNYFYQRKTIFFDPKMVSSQLVSTEDVSRRKTATSEAVQRLHVQTDSRVFADMADQEDNPCLSCGACCQHFRVSMYMGEMASSPGGTVPDELVSAVNPFIVCMKGTEMGHGRCVALRGVVGKPGIRCEIYPLRPTPCREYRVWREDGTPNPDCQRLRRNIGLAPLQRHAALASSTSAVAPTPKAPPLPPDGPYIPEAV
jgi:hypothetical protein